MGRHGLSYIHTYIHTDRHTNIQTCTHAYIHAYMHRSIQADKHTSIQAYMHTYMQTYKRTSIHTYVGTYIHAWVPACAPGDLAPHALPLRPGGQRETEEDIKHKDIYVYTRTYQSIHKIEYDPHSDS